MSRSLTWASRNSTLVARLGSEACSMSNPNRPVSTGRGPLFREKRVQCRRLSQEDREMLMRLDHVGISVGSLDRALEFYRDVLGMEVAVQTRIGGDKYDAILGLTGVSGRVALLRLGDLQIELFEFERPCPLPSQPNRPVCDHGISHFCIEVTDIHAIYAHLAAAGIRFHCPPQQFSGAIATYARDPDGNVLEFFQHTNSTVNPE
jgi:catechol 2,3-dioxygenase-like lactoylglutathione lyase family enzyme